MATICVAKRRGDATYSANNFNRVKVSRCPDCRDSGKIRNSRGVIVQCLRCRPDLWKR